MTIVYSGRVMRNTLTESKTSTCVQPQPVSIHTGISTTPTVRCFEGTRGDTSITAQFIDATWLQL